MNGRKEKGQSHLGELKRPNRRTTRTHKHAAKENKHRRKDLQRFKVELTFNKFSKSTHVDLECASVTCDCKRMCEEQSGSVSACSGTRDRVCVCVKPQGQCKLFD